jgi:hypothetical protein
MGLEGQDVGTIQQQENFSIKGKSERNLVPIHLLTSSFYLDFTVCIKDMK